MEKYLINPNQKIAKINKNIYGHFSENFAVKHDVGFFQASDEFAVAESQSTASRVDADDPERAHTAFPDFTVTERENASANQRFLHCTGHIPTTAAESLRFFEHAFFGFCASRTIRSTHLIIPLIENSNLTNPRSLFIL